MFSAEEHFILGIFDVFYTANNSADREREKVIGVKESIQSLMCCVHCWNLLLLFAKTEKLN